MKCRKCGRPAVFNMRRHKLALCEDHYPEWFIAQTGRAIKRYHMFGPDDHVLVAVSGGKDSLALWDVLLKLGYRADGLYIDLGIDSGTGYSTASRMKVEQFAAQRPDARLTVMDLKAEYGETLPEVARRVRRGRGKPCSVCGLIKRHAMNRVTRDDGYNVLATGHNLDDEAATLFGNVLHWQTGYIARQGPVLPASPEGGGLARKVKPFCQLYERETAAYTLISGIDYIYDECPYAVGATSLRHKDILNQMEERSPGTKAQFYLGFLRARKEGFFREQAGEVELHPCSKCGQPTSAPGLCAFCRLWERAP